MRRCNKCKELKPESAYYPDARKSSGLYPQCKKCVNKRQQVRNLKRYGVTPEQYQEMLTKQHGVCAICGNPEMEILNGRTKALCVDHCHKTGRVRGLLCSMCNKMLGNGRDDPSILILGAKYLENC